MPPLHSPLKDFSVRPPFMLAAIAAAIVLTVLPGAQKGQATLAKGILGLANVWS